MNRFCVLLLLCAACFMGCATPPAMYPAFLTDDTAEAAFSDQINRDLVKQTRKLMVLKTQDYLLGADDVLDVSIFEWEMTEETKTLECRIAESGIISLPVLGIVEVAGKTLHGAKTAIENKLAKSGVLQNPRVAVSVKEYRSRRIAVMGAVNAPGVYALHENVSTLMEMLTMAGGPSGSAGQLVYVLRNGKDGNDPLRIVVNTQELFDKGNFELNAVLQGDDIVYVPRAPLIYVYGEVQSPGGFSLSRSMRVLEALALAGGCADKADKRKCFLVRRTAEGGERVIPIDIALIEKAKHADVFLREGDVVRVPKSTGKSVLYEVWGIFKGIFTFTYDLKGG